MTIYATYIFYKNTYKGVIIPDEDTFKRLVFGASAYIKSITFNNVDDYNYDESVQYATCSVAEVLYEQETIDKNDISSESVGNHSRTYGSAKKTDKEREIQKYKSAKLYLAHTGLLYGGLK